MKTITWTLIAAAVFNLTACAFDKNSSLDTKRQIEDRAALTEKYSQITGLYSGTVLTRDENGKPYTQTVELSLYTVEIGNGTDANGNPKTIPGLAARYRRTDIVLPDQILTVNYFPEVSPPQVIMTNVPASGASNNQTALTINSYVSGDGFVGTVTTAAGPLGTIQVHLISKEASGPNQGDQNEQNERLRRMYAKVAGVYTGIVTPDPRQATKFKVRVELYVGQKEDPTLGLIPVLLGNYQRSDDPTGDRELNLKADYKSDSNHISIISTGARKNPNSTDSMSIDGSIESGVITGIFTDNVGRGSNVVLKKQAATIMKKK